jgi:hypothetical protein
MIVEFEKNIKISTMEECFNALRMNNLEVVGTSNRMSPFIAILKFDNTQRTSNLKQNY